MIELGARSYASRAAATRHAREILHTAPLDVHLEGDDRDFVIAFYRLRFDEEPENIMVRVRSKVRAFYAISGTDERRFSYKILQAPPSPHSRVREALRREVWPEIHERRSRVAHRACDRCKHDFPVDQIEFDHNPPFSQLVQGFLESTGLPLIGIEVQPTHYGQAILDPRIAEQWRVYHGRNARVRPMCRPCHLKFGGDKA